MLRNAGQNCILFIIPCTFILLNSCSNNKNHINTIRKFNKTKLFERTMYIGDFFVFKAFALRRNLCFFIYISLFLLLLWAFYNLYYQGDDQRSSKISFHHQRYQRDHHHGNFSEVQNIFLSLFMQNALISIKICDLKVILSNKNVLMR